MQRRFKFLPTLLVACLTSLLVSQLQAQLVNAALGGTASASTEGFGGVAARAIDGNTDGIFNNGSVTHSAGGDLAPSWAVELGADTEIQFIRIWNRTDCCSNRLTRFNVSILAEDLSVVWTMDAFTDDTFPPINTVFPVGGVTGRSVTVSRIGPPEDFEGQYFLSLAEVEVYTGDGDLPIELVQQPQPAEVPFGGSATFSVGLINVPADATVTYQWQKDGVDIPGATEFSLALTDITSPDAGVYSVNVDDGQGNVVSSEGAALTVLPRGFAMQPQSAFVQGGSCYRLIAVVDGLSITDSITYQWKKDGVDIEGATEDSYLISELGADDAADYTVCVVADGDELVSDTASVTVVGENLALAGTAGGSSEGFGLVHANGINGNMNGADITHTDVGDPQPTWWVDLAERSAITAIVLWNRTNCCSDRLTNFRVSIFDGDDEVFAVDLYTEGGFPPVSEAIAVDSVEGTRVQVMRLGTPEDYPDQFFLSLSEVQVFGEDEGAELPPPPKNLGRHCGTRARQSSQLGGFAPGLALDGELGNFTHTVGGDDMAWWEVELNEDSEIGRIILHNRTSCCGSRLRDITVTILDGAGDVVYESDLLNPENVLGGMVEGSGPANIPLELQFGDAGTVVGRTIVISRTADPDLSGSGGTGNADEANVLSLGEVEICPPLSCEGRGNVVCDGIGEPVVEGPDEGGNFTVTLTTTATDPDGDDITYAYSVENADGPVDVTGTQDGATITYTLPAGEYTVSVVANDDPICPEGDSSTCSVDLDLGVDAGVGPFRRADANDSGAADLSDAVTIFNWLFIGGAEPPCLASADTNLEGMVTLTSGVYLLNFLFNGGPPPAAPFPDCGTSDVESDVALGCESFTSCVE